MDILLTKILATLILPPGGNLITGIAGIALLRRARLLGILLLVISFGSLLILSIPRVGDALVAGLESFPARGPQAVVAGEVGAIVILGGGRDTSAPEYGGETISDDTLARIRYGARLHRETGLPLVVSGGRVFDEGTSEAALMGDVLVNEFGVEVRWQEDRSRNTAENARNVAELLGVEGVRAVLVVTHAVHMPRATEAFERAGLRPYAAPMGYTSGASDSAVLQWLPTLSGLKKSHMALHEHLGSLWYEIRY